MAKFRDIKTLQKFAAAHASIHNHFNQDRHHHIAKWHTASGSNPRNEQRALQKAQRAKGSVDEASFPRVQSAPGIALNPSIGITNPPT